MADRLALFLLLALVTPGCDGESTGPDGDADADTALHQELDDAITEAVHAVEAAPPPPLDALFTDVYEEMPWHLREELEDIRRIRGGGG